MDPEIKREMEEIHALAKDNHQMLRAMRRHQIYALIWTIVVWVIVLALPLYLYQQYLQPFVTKFQTTTGTTTSGLFGLPTSAEIEKLISSFQKK